MQGSRLGTFDVFSSWWSQKFFNTEPPLAILKVLFSIAVKEIVKFSRENYTFNNSLDQILNDGLFNKDRYKTYRISNWPYIYKFFFRVRWYCTKKLILGWMSTSVTTIDSTTATLESFTCFLHIVDFERKIRWKFSINATTRYARVWGCRWWLCGSWLTIHIMFPIELSIEIQCLKQTGFI